MQEIMFRVLYASPRAAVLAIKCEHRLWIHKAFPDATYIGPVNGLYDGCNPRPSVPQIGGNQRLDCEQLTVLDGRPLAT